METTIVPGLPAIIEFPLVTADAQDYLAGATIAAGDAKVCGRLGTLTNLAVESVAFTSGGTTEIKPGDTIAGATSTETAVVCYVHLTSGSWAGGDAAGTLWCEQVSGVFQAENLNISGGATNVATIGADFTAGLFGETGGGWYYVVLTSAETVFPSPLRIAIVDQTATKEWEDQGIVGHLSAEQYQGAIWVDPNRGTASREAGYGTPENPVSNFADGIFLGDAIGLATYRLQGNANLAALSGINTIEGFGRFSSLLTLNGVDIGSSLRIQNCAITGAQNNALEFIYADNCRLYACTGLVMLAHQVEILTSIAFRSGAASGTKYFDGVLFTATPEIDLTGHQSGVAFVKCSGDVSIANSDQAGATCIVEYTGGGTVTIDATCTAGTITIRGNCELVDNSNGATVNDERNETRVADQVWEEAIADHSGTAGSTAEQLAGITSATGAAQLTVNVKVGGVNVQGVEVDLYESDGTTFKTRESTNGSGNAVFSVDDATDYYIYPHLNGYSFTASTVTMSGNTTKNMTGTAADPTADATDYELLELKRQRVVYNDDNDVRPLVAQLVIDGIKKTPTSATVDIFDPDGTQIVDGATATVSGTRITYSVDTTTTGSYPIAQGYYAVWYIVFDGSTYDRRTMFDVVRVYLDLPLTYDRMLDRDDELRAMEYAGYDDMRGLLNALEEEIQLLIESREFSEGELIENMILDHGKLATVARLKGLSMLFHSKGNTEKGKHYQDEFDSMWPAFLANIRFDTDQDGEEASERGTIVGPRFKM